MNRFKDALRLIVLLLSMGLLVETVSAQTNLYSNGGNVGNSSNPNRVVVGDDIPALPYNTFPNQNNKLLQIIGNTTGYGIPVLMMHSRSGNVNAGNIYFTNSAYTDPTKIGAYIKAKFHANTLGTSLELYTREGDGPNTLRKVVIDRKGKMAIGGINTPNAMLHVVEPANSTGSTLMLQAGTDSNPNLAFHSGGLQWNIVNNNVSKDLIFQDSGMNQSEVIRFKQGGAVCIGTSNSPAMTAADGSAYNFFVNGGGLFKEVKVELGWADYVLAKNYNRISLGDEAAFIEENGHLSGFLSAKEMDGYINLGDVTRRQQVKIEEMRLDQIEQDRIIQNQTTEIAELKSMVIMLMEKSEK